MAGEEQDRILAAVQEWLPVAKTICLGSLPPTIYQEVCIDLGSVADLNSWKLFAQELNCFTADQIRRIESQVYYSRDEDGPGKKLLERLLQICPDFNVADLLMTLLRTGRLDMYHDKRTLGRLDIINKLLKQREEIEDFAKRSIRKPFQATTSSFENNIQCKSSQANFPKSMECQSVEPLCRELRVTAYSDAETSDVVDCDEEQADIPQSMATTHDRVGLLITYAVDNRRFRSRIIHLARSLDHNNVLICIDTTQKHLKGQNKSAWIQHRFRQVDAVLVCASPTYLKVINGANLTPEEASYNAGLSIEEIYQLLQAPSGPAVLTLLMGVEKSDLPPKLQITTFPWQNSYNDLIFHINSL